jgi:predicted ABC-type ATPase
LPYLTVIAGPNGAGKSTYSEILLLERGIKSFDYDKELEVQWRNFSYDPSVERGVRESVERHFIEAKQSALLSQSNFSFETNYHTEEVINTVKTFSSSGFFTELIFIALESSESAIERVKDRVAKGGHSVDEETVRERFRLGLHLLDNSFSQYDTVSICLSETNALKEILFIEPEQRIFKLFHTLPSQLKNKLPNLAFQIAKEN